MDLAKGLMGGAAQKAIEALEKEIEGMYEKLWGLLPGYITCCCCCCPAKTAVGLLFTCCGCMIPEDAQEIPKQIAEAETKLEEMKAKLEE